VRFSKAQIVGTVFLLVVILAALVIEHLTGAL
jgi:hypothetical protein